MTENANFAFQRQFGARLSSHGLWSPRIDTGLRVLVYNGGLVCLSKLRHRLSRRICCTGLGPAKCFCCEAFWRGEMTLVFHHIPKTAGVSLLSYVSEGVPQSRIFPFYQLAELRGRYLPEHLPWGLIAGHFGYDIPEFLGIFEPIRITQLREPVDRYVSTFYHAKREPNFPHFDAETRKKFFGMDLEDVLCHAKISRALANTQCEIIGSTIDAGLWRTLLDPLKRPPRIPYTLDLSVKRLDDFLVVGLQEKFSLTMDLLSYHLRKRPIEDPPRLNVDPTKSSRKSLSSTSKQEIIELNQDDILLYRTAADHFKTLVQDAASTGLPSLRTARLKFLEHRYRKAFIARAAPSLPWLARVDGPFPGRGWHGVEYPPYAVFRWTSGDGLSSNGISDVDFVVPETDVLVRFLIEHSITPRAFSEVSTFANGEHMESTFIERADGKREVQMRVPKRLISDAGGFLRCGIRPGETAVPKEVDPSNQDARRLGLAVGAVRVEQG